MLIIFIIILDVKRNIHDLKVSVSTILSARVEWLLTLSGYINF